MPREARKKLKVKAPPLCPALPDRRGGPAALALVCKPAGLRTLLGGPPRRGARAGFVFDSWEGPVVIIRGSIAKCRQVLFPVPWSGRVDSGVTLTHDCV